MSRSPPPLRGLFIVRSPYPEFRFAALRALIRRASGTLNAPGNRVVIFELLSDCDDRVILRLHFHRVVQMEDRIDFPIDGQIQPVEVRVDFASALGRHGDQPGPRLACTHRSVAASSFDSRKLSELCEAPKIQKRARRKSLTAIGSTGGATD